MIITWPMPRWRFSRVRASRKYHHVGRAQHPPQLVHHEEVVALLLQVRLRQMLVFLRRRLQPDIG
jgi:hypothetical protein